MVGTTIGADREGRGRWHLVIPALGGLLLVGAVAKAAVELAAGGGPVEATLDLILLSFPALVMLYTGRWLPTASIEPSLYPRIVGWIGGGVAVMGVVLSLRVVHPGVTVDYAFGTQAVLLSIGSIAGLGIGIHEALAFSHASALEEQNEKLRRAEREREEAIEQLEASNERLEQFAYAASHDLQEPLRMVTRYLELTERRFGDDLDEDCREFMTFAIDGAERMRGMIDGLLEYSRVETQAGGLEPVDLDDVLDDVLADLRLRFEETDAQLTREPLPTVEGDERQLHQLFQNLLTNAVDYSGDEPPRIHVAADTDDEEAVVSVSDEGIGIEPGNEDRIFDIFQRLHSHDEQAGSGIGLALCQRIVQRHDGALWVDAEPGEGSTFSFTLPTSPEQSDEGRVAPTMEH